LIRAGKPRVEWEENLHYYNETTNDATNALTFADVRDVVATANLIVGVLIMRMPITNRVISKWGGFELDDS